ncbi:MAG: CvpA family protein [Alphaproteobacteria bacterium]|nr:CvpA family protein [Alphaproteobacteria bacterium]
MTELHITWLDIAVSTILILSIGFAIYRGFVRETLSIFAWAAAAFATLYFGHYVVPLLAPHMSPALAGIAAYSAVFLLVLMPLLFLGGRFSRRVQESPVGMLDRVLGAVFGILRGLAAVAVLYILYSLVVPVPSQARWIKEARTLALIQRSASALLNLLPDSDAQYLKDRTLNMRSAQGSGPVPPAGPMSVASRHTHRKTVHKGYGADDRRALNRLIEATGNGGR